jgi:hypothetical protein
MARPLPAAAVGDELGVEKTTIRAVAQPANVPTMSLDLHFASNSLRERLVLTHGASSHPPSPHGGAVTHETIPGILS